MCVLTNFREVSFPFTLLLSSLSGPSSVKVKVGSYSPAPRRRDDYSASPPRSHHTQSPRRLPKGHEEDERRSYSPAGRGGGERDADTNGKRSPPSDTEGSPPRTRRSPRQSSGSPVGSRSRSPEASPARSD
uniref:Uncharacterized protein n=1 Tax=Aegilops tauschii subsp. strangulata TaxID=200361 RepID=A0A453H2C3_AEGTS